MFVNSARRLQQTDGSRGTRLQCEDAATDKGAIVVVAAAVTGPSTICPLNVPIVLLVDRHRRLLLHTQFTFIGPYPYIHA